MTDLVSTRDPEAHKVDYEEALVGGLAPDGGLYLPEGANYPNISIEELGSLRGRSYARLAAYLKDVLTDTAIDRVAELKINEEAYHPSAFPTTRAGIIAPVTEVADDLYIQRLSAGPTAAFKDFGLRSLAREISYVLNGRCEDLTLLGATSGDTGSAAEAAFKRIGSVSIFMLSPLHGSMTPFQRAQMGVLSDERTHNLSYDGTFDECQDVVKDLAQEPEFQNLGAVNSTNWGRLVAQVVYYFDAYLQVAGGKVGRPVDFVVPTGNFGNALSGHIARRMGLPIRQLIVATNENDVMDRLVQTGIYVKTPLERRQDTSSPSMDITKASNYERLVYEMFSGDPVRTRAYMEQFEREGRVAFEDHDLSQRMFARLGITSGSSRHDDRLASIQRIYGESGVFVDPHTADGVSVALRQGELEVPTICLATAESIKFEGTVREALGKVATREPRFEDLENNPAAHNFVVVDSIEAVRRYIREHRD